jgi:hypothetical protein
MRLAPPAVFFSLSLVPAVALAEPPLHLPWTCDDAYPVTNGHQTSSHTGNDAWAWDFGLPVDTPVLAPADGVVRLVKMDSSQGGCDGAYANDANYVVVDFEDGTEALLMHLKRNSSDLQVGDAVKQGDVVGRVGLTGWVCGAHLHFQIQETCDSWWCQSIPAEFVEHGDPGEGAPLQSNNCPVVEPCDRVLGGAETIVDDTDARCFQRITSWFWPGAGGWDDGHIYTWANAAAEPDTIGRWEFGVGVPGRYRLEAFIPDEDASSQLATYEIQTGGGVVSVGPIDQSTNKGWVDLGAHEIVAGDEHWVRLRDNTGEDRDLDRALAFDAIRWRLEPEGGDESSGSGDATTTDDDGGESPAPSSTSAAGDDDGASPSSSDSGGDDGSALPPTQDGDRSRCAIGRRGSNVLDLALVVFVLALGRRRSARV